ncbi:unnamed protein product, partial [Cladocopium goreaui]
MDVAENLVEAGVAATPTAVCVELGDDTVPASAVIEILRHRRRTYGKSTRVLQESQATFESAVEKYKEEDGQQDLCLFKLKLKRSLPPWNSSRKEKQEKEHKEAKQADVVWMPLRADPVGSPQSPFWIRAVDGSERSPEDGRESRSAPAAPAAPAAHAHLGVILAALPSLPAYAQGADELGEGGYVKWGLEQQIFAAVFFVIFPFGVLYLLFSGRFGWWNYGLDGKELTAEEYKKANKVDKPTWGRFPWELEGAFGHATLMSEFLADRRPQRRWPSFMRPAKCDPGKAANYRRNGRKWRNWPVPLLYGCCLFLMRAKEK